MYLTLWKEIILQIVLNLTRISRIYLGDGRVTNPIIIHCQSHLRRLTSAVLWLSTLEKCAVESSRGDLGLACRSWKWSPARWARDKLNPMKCGAKYTWVGRDKRKTAPSFPDTTRDAQMVAILKCVIIPIVMDTCTFLSLSWCYSTHSLARYKIWGVTLDSLESSQQWLMRSIIGCNFCCLDNLFWHTDRDWVKKVYFQRFQNTT